MSGDRRPERGTWSRRAGWLTPVLLAGAILGSPPEASAQAPAVPGTDPGWLPWLGCWEVVGEGAGADDGGAPGLVCLRSVTDGPHVELVTVEEGRVVGRDLLRADGREHASARDGCEGRERGAFSAEGSRVYFRAEHVCPGGVERTTSGLLAWVSPYEWMEVRTVEVRGTSRTWVRRYRAAPEGAAADAGVEGLVPEPGMAVESARMAAAARIRVDDVIEAAGAVHPDGVKAWVAEQADPFDLDAGALLRMADAGVPGPVVDVVVAVSYPDRFVVDRSGAVDEQAPVRDLRPGWNRGSRPRWGFGVGGWYPRWYGYGPYGYYGSYYRYPYGYRPAPVYVVPRSGSGGRVVPGGGYSRSSGSDGARARPKRRPSTSSSGGSSSAPSAGRSGGSGATVSPSGGYRGGSASDADDSGTARRRGGGSPESDDGGSGRR